MGTPDWWTLGRWWNIGVTGVSTIRNSAVLFHKPPRSFPLSINFRSPCMRHCVRSCLITGYIRGWLSCHSAPSLYCVDISTTTASPLSASLITRSFLCITFCISWYSALVMLCYFSLNGNNSSYSSYNIISCVWICLCRLEVCGMTSSGCDDLRSILINNRSLTRLYLSWNNLEDSGIKLLCEGLRHPGCTLQRLRWELSYKWYNILQDSGINLLCEGSRHVT